MYVLSNTIKSPENIIRKETKGVDLIAKADRQFYDTIANIKNERADLFSRFSSNL